MGCKKGIGYLHKAEYPECNRMCAGCENYIPPKTPAPKIRPCRFCGKIPEFVYQGRSVKLRCKGNDMDVSTYWAVDEREAIRIWNKSMGTDMAEALNG